MNGPNREEPSSSARTVTGPELGSSLCSRFPHATSKAISCFPITSFLDVAQGGDRGPLSSLLILRYKELGIVIQV